MAGRGLAPGVRAGGTGAGGGGCHPPPPSQGLLDVFHSISHQLMDAGAAPQGRGGGSTGAAGGHPAPGNSDGGAVAAAFAVQMDTDDGGVAVVGAPSAPEGQCRRGRGSGHSCAGAPRPRSSPPGGGAATTGGGGSPPLPRRGGCSGRGVREWGSCGVPCKPCATSTGPQHASRERGIGSAAITRGVAG